MVQTNCIWYMCPHSPLAVYGVQKNIVAPGVSATATGEKEVDIFTRNTDSIPVKLEAQLLELFFAVVPSSPVTTDDVFVKDYKFMLLEKDNVPAKKESERLLSKNTGKQFTSTTSGPSKKTSYETVHI